MQEKMAQALIEIHNLLPYSMEEESAKQDIPEDVFCSNMVCEMWKIMHRFKDGAFEAIASKQPDKATDVKPCYCAAADLLVDALNEIADYDYKSGKKGI